MHGVTRGQRKHVRRGERGNGSLRGSGGEAPLACGMRRPSFYLNVEGQVFSCGWKSWGTQDSRYRHSIFINFNHVR